jgi:hypothetical protein
MDSTLSRTTTRRTGSSTTAYRAGARGGGSAPRRRGERMMRRAFVWAVVGLLVFMLVATLVLDATAGAATGLSG